MVDGTLPSTGYRALRESGAVAHGSDRGERGERLGCPLSGDREGKEEEENLNIARSGMPCWRECRMQRR